MDGLKFSVPLVRQAHYKLHALCLRTSTHDSARAEVRASAQKRVGKSKSFAWPYVTACYPLSVLCALCGNRCYVPFARAKRVGAGKGADALSPAGRKPTTDGAEYEADQQVPQLL